MGRRPALLRPLRRGLRPDADDARRAPRARHHLDAPPVAARHRTRPLSPRGALGRLAPVRTASRPAMSWCSFVSRLVKEKGLDVFAEIVRALQGEGRPARALVVGDGPERDGAGGGACPRPSSPATSRGDDLATAYASSRRVPVPQRDRDVRQRDAGGDGLRPRRSSRPTPPVRPASSTTAGRDSSVRPVIAARSSTRRGSSSRPRPPPPARRRGARGGAGLRLVRSARSHGVLLPQGRPPLRLRARFGRSRKVIDRIRYPPFLCLTVV